MGRGGEEGEINKLWKEIKKWTHLPLLRKDWNMKGKVGEGGKKTGLKDAARFAYIF